MSGGRGKRVCLVMVAWDDGMAEVCHSVTESVEWQGGVPVVATGRLKFVLATRERTPTRADAAAVTRIFGWHLNSY